MGNVTQIAEVDPFAGLDPQVLYGTGEVFFEDLETGLDVSAGDFELIHIAGEGDSFRYFDPPDGEIPIALAVTTAYRMELTGDDFSVENVARLFNQLVVANAAGYQLNLQTIRPAPIRRLTFRKTLDADLALRCGIVCSEIELVFWRTHFAVPFTYELAREAPTLHFFDIVAVPDAIAHSSNPFGIVNFVCPVEAS